MEKNEGKRMILGFDGMMEEKFSMLSLLGSYSLRITYFTRSCTFPTEISLQALQGKKLNLRETTSFSCRTFN